MKHYGDNFIPAIPVEDPLLHTDDRPFCPFDGCGCHDDRTLVGEVNDAYQQGKLTGEEATRLVQGRQI